MAEAFICDTVRTPVGRYNGSLSTVRTDDLAALPIKELIRRHPKVDWAKVDDVVYGCVNQAGEDNRNVGRMAGLLAGLPVESAGQTVNRLCGSGIEATGSAARMIRAGDAQFVIAGGVEGMTRSPYVMGKPSGPFDRAMKLEDTVLGWRFVNPEMKRLHGVDAMGQTAENVAMEHQVSREDQDGFALRSQQRAAKAMERGFFRKETIPVTVKAGKKEFVFDTDEHPRADTTLEALAKLPGAFRDGGSVTAGNSSGINDGANAMIVASEAAVKKYGFKPRARVIATAAAGVPPRVMGIGPVPATRKVLEIAGLKLSDMDVIELNEAFAAQGLAVMRQLGLADDAQHVNPNGGAIALGHPLGASGGRLITTALNQLEAIDGRYALCTMCIGVGQGIAMVIERVK
jgi:3-oxoadipyl-CoA thiolase